MTKTCHSTDLAIQPNERVPGVPDEDIPFEKPGDLESTPCPKQSGEPGPDDKPLYWTRYPGGKKPDVEDEDLPFDRPSNLRFVPCDGHPSNEWTGTCTVIGL